MFVRYFSNNPDICGYVGKMLEQHFNVKNNFKSRGHDSNSWWNFTVSVSQSSTFNIVSNAKIINTIYHYHPTLLPLGQKFPRKPPELCLLFSMSPEPSRQGCWSSCSSIQCQVWKPVWNPGLSKQLYNTNKCN